MELKKIGERVQGYGNEEHYNAQKATILASVDSATEYVAGDLIFCKNCKGVKSLDLPKRRLYVRCICSCEAAAISAAKKRESAIMRVNAFRTSNSLRLGRENAVADFSGVAAIAGATADENYKTAAARCEKFCRNFAAVKKGGYGIYLHGGAKTGKTYFAAAILNALQNSGIACIITTWNEIQRELQATYKQTADETEWQVIKRYATIDVLFIDDFCGIETKKNDFFAKKFIELIEQRNKTKRPTIYTARKSLRQLVSDCDINSGIYDVIHEKAIEMELTGIIQKPVTAQKLPF